MKHAILPVILAVAVPVFAAEQTPVKTLQQPAVQQDSPLVAAAKRTNRLGKKPALVITNDNLVHMNDGRGFTTTTGQQDVTAPAGTAAPTPEMRYATAARNDAQSRTDVAAQQKQQQDMRNAKAAARQTMYEGQNFLDDDPAQHEHAMDMLTQPTQPQKSSNTSAPQPSQSYSNQKPPQD